MHLLDSIRLLYSSRMPSPPSLDFSTRCMRAACRPAMALNEITRSNLWWQISNENMIIAANAELATPWPGREERKHEKRSQRAYLRPHACLAPVKNNSSTVATVAISSQSFLYPFILGTRTFPYYFRDVFFSLGYKVSRRVAFHHESLM